MPKNSILKFYNYKVEEISFKSISQTADRRDFNLRPCFRQDIVDCGKDMYDLHISVEISPTDDHPSPFYLKVAIVGHFSFCKDNDESFSPELKEKLIKSNATSILFPFLRSTVATVTANANLPALLLPIMNFSDEE